VDLTGKRILIVKMRYIGDTLSIAPVVDNLREKAPGAIVDVLVNKGTEPVISHHPGIRKTWVYDYRTAKKAAPASIGYQVKLIRKLRSRRYDVVIDYTHGDRAALLCFLTGAPVRITHSHAGSLSRKLMNRFADSDPRKTHIVDHQLASLELLGLGGFRRTSTMVIPGEVRERVDHMVSRSGLSGRRPWVAVHPGAGSEFRMWPPERFADIARRCKERYGASIILLGGPREAGVLKRVVSAGGWTPDFCSCDLSILETGEFLRRSTLFLGNDSAPGHVAAAVQCPTVSLFGPTFPHMWRPLSPRGEVLFKNVPCCGCRQLVCSRPDSRCMDLIETEEVWEAVQKLMDGALKDRENTQKKRQSA